ncbi:Acg family FMN-binding oxidoreductase [Nocardia aurantiaca]|uniref:NAD(P)H nitroreductase n=1 Tax=Nocardia aurantiaca TaxID=2675850 RepID=A0A6I3L171_9NOCA|nr:nitroreductase family protein [Nocardia aurantiaca]MTE14314.1 NAD(P)H nitroreductase [Nocardia aurantiaca]
MSPLPSSETIEQAVRLAGRAPSLHNSQPWRWVFDGEALHLFSVRARMLPATDHSGRQMLISCGIALGHLRAALAATGWQTHVTYFPNPTRHDQLATVTLEPARIVTDADRDRAAAITVRYTDRLPFSAPAEWREFEPVLPVIVDPFDAVITVLPPEARTELARASRMTAAVRRYDSGYQAELQWWAGHSLAAEGIPPSARVTPDERQRVDLSRVLPAVDDEPRRTEIKDDESVVLVVSSGSSFTELLRCGEALSTILLECTVAGYATCPISHVTEVPQSRSVIQGLTGRAEQPQVLIRVGTVPASDRQPTHTPRLPLTQILDISAAATPGVRTPSGDPR